MRKEYDFTKAKKTPYACRLKRVISLIGSVKSGIPDLGSAHREHLLKRFKRE
jgi:hypothetical protein